MFKSKAPDVTRAAFDKISAAPRHLVRRLKSDGRFIKNWVDHPLKTGAITPSGNALACAMSSFVPIDSDLPVLEIGPGTGSVTRALLHRGVNRDRLVALEFNDEFYAHIKDNFPGVHVIQGDAYRLTETLRQYFDETPQFAAIVSSLPLLTRAKEHREALVNSGLSHLAENAPFVQFSYGLTPPLAPPAGVTMTHTGWIVRNIPPARVFVYRNTR